MPSIHPDYEYDIFISYRQNDNRSDQWVSNFVEALQEELVATLKNPVSIYFDENPHDGLLETHQVDASLAKKLKCLIFIPIISQTYCDIKSYAWEQEFLPFVNMAKEDELGINITLSNGNVASRVLPVKIHDLENEDQFALEAILNGPLRSIDFIYQEPGVNRPLAPNDNEEKNINKTLYKNQVNKVANALKDIGLSIIRQSEGKITVPVIDQEPPRKSSTKGISLGLAAIIIAVLSFFGYQQFYNSPLPAEAETENITIAVLAFNDQSPNGDQEWLGDGMADEILNVLAKVNGLQVTGKTSSFSFKGKGLTTKAIGETLNVSTVLEGSVSKIGDKLRITAQLIDVETDTHIWSKKYDRDATDMFAIIDEVAQSIAGSMKNELSIEELENIKVRNKINPDALEYYLKGQYYFDEYISIRSEEKFRQSENMFIKAISVDSIYADAYASLADLYWQKASFGSKDYIRKSDSVSLLAYNINPNNAYALITRGIKYLLQRLDINKIDSAFYYYKRAYLIDPNDMNVLYNIVSLYTKIGLYDQAIAIDRRILRGDPLNSYSRLTLARALGYSGNFKEAKVNFRKVIELAPNDLLANRTLLYMAIFYDRDTTEANSLLEFLKEAYPNRNFSYYNTLLRAVEGNKDAALSLKPSLIKYSLLDMKKEALDLADSYYADTNFTSSWTYLHLLNDPTVNFIREDARFKKILAAAKKVHDERVAKYGHLFDERN